MASRAGPRSRVHCHPRFQEPERKPVEHACCPIYAAQHGIGVLHLEQHGVINGFVPTDYGEQGMTEKKVIMSLSKKPFPPHLNAASLYVMLSRARQPVQRSCRCERE